MIYSSSFIHLLSSIYHLIAYFAGPYRGTDFTDTNYEWQSGCPIILFIIIEFI